MSIGLRTRMMLLALLPATLVAVLLTTVFVLHAIDNLEQGLHTRGRAISRQMASAAEFGIFAGQRAILAALTEATLRIDPDVSGAAIIDAQGSTMARAGRLDVSVWRELVRVDGRRLGPDALLFVEPVLRGSVPVDDIYSGTEEIRSPASNVLGYVVVELSRREVSSKSERLLALGALIALVVSALGAWLARRIARAVTIPLLAASEVVERIGSGDTTARLPTASTGALQSLAAGINDMAERIGVTQDELRERVSIATLDLLREKEAAEHATIAKSHFLAAASHDLRQPLHALGLFVSGLAQSSAATHEPKLVAQTQAAVEALQNLLDAILDVSRLDGGNVVPRIGDFSLGNVLNRLGDELSVLAQHKGLQLKLRPTRIRVRSDQQIIERILHNLVGNALRYTVAGGVLVGCRRRADRVRVEIWDTGPGIPENAREEIFEEYVQLGNPERDHAKGLGLGLAICRRLAALLAAPMGVRSRPGRGSAFWIDLPVAPADAAGAGAADGGIPWAGELSDPARLTGTVLVVEADALVRAGMGQTIVGWGGSALLAAGREDAWRCCRECASPPDLVICNISLVGALDGIGLAQELQREFTHMGALLVSADVSESSQTAARRAGFALLKQPVPPGRLRAALQQLLTVHA